MCTEASWKKTREQRLGEKWAKGHVMTAVSCCLEMALWRTLWMADQVSRMASGGLSASFMWLLMFFFALEDERDKVDVWISVKFWPSQLSWSCDQGGCWLLQ